MRSIDFFRDEVRTGFYVPTAIKQAWAAELTVLEEIDAICRKYDIQYYAEWGTLLGAVRHGGFVPWDDDLDIGMRREDYVRFCEVADAELPREYVIHNYERKEDHWLFLARVVNHSHICFEPTHLRKYYNFPWMASVDIFIQDYLYSDEDLEKKRCDDIMEILSLAEAVIGDKPLGRERIVGKLNEICRKYHLNLPSDIADRQLGIELYRLAEQRMAEVPADDSERMAQIFPWGLKGNRGLPKDYYDGTIRLPFENTTIPVPKHYHEVLRARYGDNCMQPIKAWGGHGYPFFEGQKRNLEKVAGEELPHFAFSDDLLSNRTPRPNDCDKPRKVLFLPIGPQEWEGFKWIYEIELQREDTEVNVIPLPLMPKDPYGMIEKGADSNDSFVEIELYPDDVSVGYWRDYDVIEEHPDVIYIQNPYDGVNPYLTIPETFYTVNLRNYTNRLVYVPPYDTDEYDRDDTVALYNYKHYVTAPGVIYADEVIVQSEKIRENYIHALCDFSDDTYRKVWSEKIRVRPEEKNMAGDAKDTTRRILYCIGLGEMTGAGDRFVKAVRERLEVLESDKDRIKCGVVMYPDDIGVWEEVDAENTSRLLAVFEDFSDDEAEDDMVGLEDYCAYYGSFSPYVSEFVLAKKPVMIADYNCRIE